MKSLGLPSSRETRRGLWGLQLCSVGGAGGWLGLFDGFIVKHAVVLVAIGLSLRRSYLQRQFLMEFVGLRHAVGNTVKQYSSDSGVQLSSLFSQQTVFFLAHSQWPLERIYNSAAQAAKKTLAKIKSLL